MHSDPSASSRNPEPQELAHQGSASSSDPAQAFVDLWRLELRGLAHSPVALACLVVPILVVALLRYAAGDWLRTLPFGIDATLIIISACLVTGVTGAGTLSCDLVSAGLSCNPDPIAERRRAARNRNSYAAGRMYRNGSPTAAGASGNGSLADAGMSVYSDVSGDPGSSDSSSSSLALEATEGQMSACQILVALIAIAISATLCFLFAATRASRFFLVLVVELLGALPLLFSLQAFCLRYRASGARRRALALGGVLAALVPVAGIAGEIAAMVCCVAPTGSMALVAAVAYLGMESVACHVVPLCAYAVWMVVSVYFLAKALKSVSAPA